jgi:hypothetical protein
MGGGSSKAVEVEPVMVPTISKHGVTLALLKRLEKLAIEHDWITTSDVVNGFIKPETEATHLAKIAQLKAKESALVKEKQGKGKQPAVAEVVVDISDCSIEGLMNDSHKDVPHPTINLTYSQCFTDTASVFVSHSRDQPFSVLVSTLESFAVQQEARKPDKPWSFWLNFLVTNEWEDKAAYPIEWYTDAYPSLIAQIGYTVVAVSPGNRPAALSDLWCLYEIYMSLKPATTASTTATTEGTATAPDAGAGTSAGAGTGAGAGVSGSGGPKSGKLFFHLCPSEREVFVNSLESDFAGLLAGWGEVDLRVGRPEEEGGR